MSNFVETFKAGKLGKNFGLPTGIPALDEAINGIQRKHSYGLAAAPKVGKTTLADFCFVLSPYLYCLRKGTLDNIEWVYFSGEIDRVSKEYKFAAFFMYHDFGIGSVTYKNKVYPMCEDYLMGKLFHRIDNADSEQVPILPEHENMLREIYANRIVPLFGEYSDKGEKISSGKITFIEDLENPTGLYKYLQHKASLEGDFKKEAYYITNDLGHREAKTRIVGYAPHNPDKYTIVITDHIRKLKKERGFLTKENMDKWLEYTTILRNLCSWTFVNIGHSNRGIANVERLRFAGENIFPTADDVKDTGNLAEESTVLMTLFNPSDEKYNLKRHMKVDLAGYPNYRSLHITESRYTFCPAHIQCNMIGGINYFTPLNYK